MVSRLLASREAEFSPPATMTVVFHDSVYTFTDVIRAIKDTDGIIYIEMVSKGFAEIHPPYHFFEIGNGVTNGD